MELKNTADNFIKEGKYTNAILLYNELLISDSENYKLLGNRSVAYFKLEQYDNALKDAIKCTKLKPNWGKAWGRVGGMYYGLNDYTNSLDAYKKAYELDPLKIYEKMIINNKSKLNNNDLLLTEIENNILNIFDLDNLDVGDMMGVMFTKLTSKSNILNKLSNIDFQNKLNLINEDPSSILNDTEVINIFTDLFSTMKN